MGSSSPRGLDSGRILRATRQKQLSPWEVEPQVKVSPTCRTENGLRPAFEDRSCRQRRDRLSAWYLSSDGLYVFPGDAFKGGVFLSVVNEGLHILLQMELFFGQHV